jgi:pantoate kinase
MSEPMWSNPADVGDVGAGWTIDLPEDVMVSNGETLNIVYDGEVPVEVQHYDVAGLMVQSWRLVNGEWVEVR